MKSDVGIERIFNELKSKKGLKDSTIILIVIWGIWQIISIKNDVKDIKHASETATMRAVQEATDEMKKIHKEMFINLMEDGARVFDGYVSDVSKIQEKHINRDNLSEGVKADLKEDIADLKKESSRRVEFVMLMRTNELRFRGDTTQNQLR